jgi:D-alanyl-D-alanine dipeptidase
MSNELFAISDAIPDVIEDLRYSSDRNVTGRVLCHQKQSQLRAEPLRALARAADQLRADGFQMVIWDAYRTADVQARLRQFCDDSRYVSVVSNHQRGITVDMTLSKNGVLLDMGTDHDDFSSKAQVDFADLSELQKNNRLILRRAMEAQGFSQNSYEWWHYDYLTTPLKAVIVQRQVAYDH